MEEKKQNDNLLTLKEVATLLRCSETSVRRYAKSGKLEYIKPAGKYFFKKSYIEKYLSI